MASLKKDPPPKKSAKELEVEAKMLRYLVEPKKPMLSDYKCTMHNPHYAKRLGEVLENEDEQMLKFYQEAYRYNNYMVNRRFKWHMHPRLG
jgi:hypothetical protein